MTYIYLPHMRRMIIAEEAAKILEPDYKKMEISPGLAKIINSINGNGSSQKLRSHFFRPKK